MKYNYPECSEGVPNSVLKSNSQNGFQILSEVLYVRGVTNSVSEIRELKGFTKFVIH